MSKPEGLSLQQKMETLVDSMEDNVLGVDVESLCNFLEIDFNGGKPDITELTTKSFSILDSRKIAELDPAKRNEMVKTATEVVGTVFQEYIGYMGSPKENIQ